MIPDGDLRADGGALLAADDATSAGFRPCSRCWRTEDRGAAAENGGGGE